MKTKLIISLFLFIYSFALSARRVIKMTEWKFHYGEVENVLSSNFDDTEWKSVSVPHDWAIDKPFDMSIDMQLVQVLEDGEKVPKLRTGRTGALPAFGVGYYRTVINSDTTMKGKRVRIEFDGAMSLCDCYLNGSFVGTWPYGYSSFAFDLTDKWNYDGENILVVRLNNKLKSSRWYSGAGLYRNVRLVMTSPISVSHWGTKVTTPFVSQKRGKVHIETTINNDLAISKKVSLKSILLDEKGKVVHQEISKEKVESSNHKCFSQDFEFKSPRLWSVDSPYLYQLISKVYVDGKLTDSYSTSFGIRSIYFDKNSGFFLNGKAIKLKGVCLHHDLGPLGAAVNVSALKRQLLMMKEMGCNAIRTSHNPPAPELLELCDRIGLFVQVEAFDEWQIGKNENGYHLYFDKWSKRDLQAMIRRDRNHPSVIMWSIGNEVREQNSPDGGEVAKRLVDICHREDSTRPVTAGFNNHNAAIKNGLADAVDLVGFNYKPYDYEKKHQSYPDYILYGSETASTVSSRGVYKFPATPKRGAYYHDFQMSSYDLEFPNWASTPDVEFQKQDDCEFIQGEFVWTGFDYLGEPTPYNELTCARSSYFGIVDLAGLKKDRYYLYQSKWSNKPVLHLLPHWNWKNRIGKNVPVYCYTNYPKAELFVNGKSMGVKEKSFDNVYSRYRIMWPNVIYQPGEIKVLAYDENNNIMDTETIRTADEAYQIRTTVDRHEIAADGKDLAFVTIQVLDKYGNLSPNSNHLLFFKVDGNAKLKALCNGDPTDQTSFSSNYMRVFRGKMVAIVQSSKTSEVVTLKVIANHLKGASQKICIVSK